MPVVEAFVGTGDLYDLGGSGVSCGPGGVGGVGVAHPGACAAPRRPCHRRLLLRGGRVHRRPTLAHHHGGASSSGHHATLARALLRPWSLCARWRCQIVRHHPGDLQMLMWKVHTCLRSTSFDTRKAAGQAFHAIAANYPPWKANDAGPEDGASAKQEEDHDADGLFTFATFDVLQVLRRAKPLLASQGFEFDMDPEELKLNAKDRMKLQKQQLKKSLGLGSADHSEIAQNTLHGLLDDDDLSDQQLGGKRQREEAENESAQKAAKEPKIDFAGLSAREINRKKRMMKEAAKKKSRQASMVAPTAKKTGTSSTFTDQTDPDKVVVETLDIVADEDEWAFQARCEELCNDLFHPKWEYRHGASLGLRAIISTHGEGAGKVRNVSAAATTTAHAAWLEDMALRVLCVCALDHFGDFNFDKAIAPVRDTAAQVLAAIARYMDSGAVKQILSILLTLQQHHEWKVRHGGLLGVKYLVAVRRDLIATLLPELLPVICAGLQDTSDDVRAAAAEALAPVSGDLVKLHFENVSNVVRILWDTLIELDDLTVSTSSILTLLASVLTEASAAGHPNFSSDADAKPTSELVKRLWPFFRHTLVPVRRAVLQTLERLALSVPEQWVEKQLAPTLRFIFQNILIETSDDVKQLSIRLWKTILKGRAPDNVVQTIKHHFGPWCGQLVTPAGVQLDPAHYLSVKPLLKATPGAAAAATAAAAKQAEPTTKRPAKRPKKEKKGWETDGSMPMKKPVPPAKALVGGPEQELAPDAAKVLAARWAGACALGHILSCTRDGGTINHTAIAIKELVTTKSSVRRQCGTWITAEWGMRLLETQTPNLVPKPIQASMMDILTKKEVSDVAIEELMGLLRRMRGHVAGMLQQYSASGISTTEVGNFGLVGRMRCPRAHRLPASFTTSSNPPVACRAPWLLPLPGLDNIFSARPKN